jgi:hypothetical protein
MRRVTGTLVGLVGLVLLAWSFSGARTLHKLLDDDGTESFANYGAGGIFGCVAFLAILALLGVFSACYGIHAWQRRA